MYVGDTVNRTLKAIKENSMNFIIDIGGSYRKLCQLIGGQYVDVAPLSHSNQAPLPIHSRLIRLHLKEMKRPQAQERLSSYWHSLRIY